MTIQAQRHFALEGDDYLAEYLAALEPSKPALELGKRHFGIDHRKKARRHFGKAFADIAQRAADRSENAILRQIELEQIHGDRLSRGRSTGDKPAAAFEAKQRAVEGVRADMFESNIDALFAGQFAHDAFKTVGAIIDDVIGADRFGFFRFCVIAHRGDYSAADRFGHFDRGGADAGAAGLDQYRLARLELGIVEQHVLYRAERDRCAGGVAIGHIVGNRYDQPGRHVQEVAGKAVDMETHNASNVLAEIIATGAERLAGSESQRPIGDNAVARPV